MRPHKVHVSQGPEYNGETYIWCECETKPGEEPVQCYGNVPSMSLFEGGEVRNSNLLADGLMELFMFLFVHEALHDFLAEWDKEGVGHGA